MVMSLQEKIVLKIKVFRGFNAGWFSCKNLPVVSLALTWKSPLVET